VFPDAAGQAPLPLPDPSASSTSPQRYTHVTAPPLTMDQSTDTSVGMAAQTVSHSLHYLNAHPVLNVQPLVFELFQPEGFAGGDLPLPTGVPHDIGRWGMGNGAGEDWNIVSRSAPLLNSGIPGTTGPIAIDRDAQDDVVTIHSLLTALHKDVLHFDDQGIDQVQQSQSSNAGTTHMASGSSTAVLAPTQPGADTNNVLVGAPDTSPIPCEPSHRSR